MPPTPPPADAARSWALPGAGALQDDAWRARHRLMLALLVGHLPMLLGLGLLQGRSGLHLAADLGPIAAAAVLASGRRLPRVLQEVLVACALVGCAAMAVHLSGGLGEAHYYYFVVLALLPLYQSWPPLLSAVTVVVLQHGVMGQLDPASVYGQSLPADEAWLWAVVHGAAVLATTAASALVVSLNERQRRALVAERDLARDEREAALQALAQQDALTGLPNRRSLKAHLSRSGTGVLVLDLDGFKAVNDRLGHEAGDRLLQRVALAMTSALRPGDVLVRTGGDEFAVICPDLVEDEDLLLIGERLRAAVLRSGGELGVDVSIGHSVTRPGQGPDEALAEADRAMYAVKRDRQGIAPLF